MEQTSSRPARSVAAVVAVVALTAAFAACTTPTAPVDRTGGDTLVLHLATHDGESVDATTNQGPAAFVDQLQKVSGGHLKVDLTTDYGDSAPDAETHLVEAIESDEVDGGWPATRAFARAGIEGLQAIEAPMVITNEKAVDALVSGPVADEVLSQLEGTGVIGLALMAAPLRRPVSGGEPLVAASDWKDATFRVYNSPVQAAVVRALGGRPENLTHTWADALRVGDLDGGEADVVTKDLPIAVQDVTGNVVLWPKVFVTTFNQKLFDSLTDQQREWIRKAASLATAASVSAHYDGTVDLMQLCRRGTKVLEATPRELAGLRSDVQPVLADLRNDPETSTLMRAVEDLAEKYPGVDVPPPSKGCSGSGTTTSNHTPSEAAPVPDGTYRVEVPVSATADVGNGPGWSGTWTMKIADETYVVSCRPLDLPGTDCGHAITDAPLEAGSLQGDDHTVLFVSDPEMLSQLNGCTLPSTEDDPDHCVELAPYGAHWVIDGSRLTFDDLTGPPNYYLSLRPWQRVT